jgi:hypothetical protein
MISFGSRFELAVAVVLLLAFEFVRLALEVVGLAFELLRLVEALLAWLDTSSCKYLRHARETTFWKMLG